MIRPIKSFDPKESRLAKMEELVKANWELFKEYEKLTPEDKRVFLPIIEHSINNSKQILKSFAQ